MNIPVFHGILWEWNGFLWVNEPQKIVQNGALEVGHTGFLGSPGTKDLFGVFWGHVGFFSQIGFVKVG